MSNQKPFREGNQDYNHLSQWFPIVQVMCCSYVYRIPFMGLDGRSMRCWRATSGMTGRCWWQHPRRRPTHAQGREPSIANLVAHHVFLDEGMAWDGFNESLEIGARGGMQRTGSQRIERLHFQASCHSVLNTRRVCSGGPPWWHHFLVRLFLMLNCSSFAKMAANLALVILLS